MTIVQPAVARARRVLWCWRCLRPRRFHDVHWPPIDATMQERIGVFVCPKGHAR